MAIIGIWIAIVGYGIAYAGMQKLAGKQCGIVDGFRNRCGQTAGTTAAPASGQTQQTQLLAQRSQQASMIGTQPIVQVA